MADTTIPPVADDEAMRIAAIIERVEAATGPDRELDGCIWWATLSPREIDFHDSTGFVRECIKRDGSAGMALQQFFDSSNPYCLARVAFERPYTKSLDAAMTLIEADAFWRLGNDGEGPDPAAFKATVTSNTTRGGLLFHDAVAATPALALCAAALKARAALQNGRAGDA